MENKFDPAGYRAFTSQARENVGAWPDDKKAAADAAFSPQLDVSPSELRARCLREIELARESAQAALQHASNARSAYLELSREVYDLQGLPWIGLEALGLLGRACMELPQAPTTLASPATYLLPLSAPRGDCACDLAP